eukprot:c16902_g1_i1.p1 GENE.c16902_g1_i1~~c16902_g1_i1.p1  ORF type:complete len:443 (-),score=100.21 c16902_g1_i1:147-1475(-)
MEVDPEDSRNSRSVRMQEPVPQQRSDSDALRAARLEALNRRMSPNVSNNVPEISNVPTTAIPNRSTSTPISVRPAATTTTQSSTPAKQATTPVGVAQASEERRKQLDAALARRLGANSNNNSNNNAISSPVVVSPSRTTPEVSSSAPPNPSNVPRSHLNKEVAEHLAEVREKERQRKAARQVEVQRLNDSRNRHKERNEQMSAILAHRAERQRDAAIRENIDLTTTSLRVRLPSGAVVVENFLNSTTLNEVFALVMGTRNYDQNLEYFTPFPHHIFSQAEMNQPLDQLGLWPRGVVCAQFEEMRGVLQQHTGPAAPLVNNATMRWYDPNGDDEDDDPENVIVQQDDIDPSTMSYEQLLELEERIGSVGRGLEPSQMHRIPRSTVTPERALELEGTVCPICQCPMIAGERASTLNCTHSYHSDCLVRWLGVRKDCCVCKAAVV